MFKIVLCFVLINIVKIECAAKLQEQYRWTQLDYFFPNEYARTHAIATKQFIPENNLPVGIEVWKDKLFVSVPRWREGIPSTLNYIPLQYAPKDNPLLIPYPNIESNALGNCQTGLNTVYRIKADACDRLWVLDTGTFGIENTTQNLCPYTLNIFDLNTDKIIRKYELKAEDINANTFIANIAVDLGKTCDDAYAYMSDELGYGLIVYSWKENKSWRFSHSYFMPDPLTGDFNIEGLNFQWGAEGIFGISLSPLQADFERILYFSPLASNRGFAVSTKVLRNSSRTEDSYHDFIALAEKGPNSHATSQVISEDGIQLFNLIDRNAVGCWDTLTEYGAANIAVVDKDDVGLVFPADVKIDRNENVWVISDKMSTFLLSNLNFNNINFRIYGAPLKHLIAGTVCDRNQHVNLNQLSYTRQPIVANQFPFNNFDQFNSYLLKQLQI